MSADLRILLTLSMSVVTGERSFFQLKLINSHNHIAGEIGESGHVSIESGTSPPEGHCQSLCQKHQEGKVLRSMLDFLFT